MAETTFLGWDAYEDAVVDVDLGDREVTLGREGIVRGEPWAPDRIAYVITAHNPGRKASMGENASAQDRLLAHLAAAGLGWLPAVGRSRDRSWQEPSVVVQTSEAHAVEIGTLFGQDAIFSWDGRTLRVVACPKT